MYGTAWHPSESRQDFHTRPTGTLNPWYTLQAAASLTAKCGELEDTIVLNGVEVHNEAYTLPDIAAAMALGNWFDDIKDDDDGDVIEQPEGFYSIADSLADLMEHNQRSAMICVTSLTARAMFPRPARL